MVRFFRRYRQQAVKTFFGAVCGSVECCWSVTFSRTFVKNSCRQFPLDKSAEKTYEAIEERPTIMRSGNTIIAMGGIIIGSAYRDLGGG